MPIQKIEKIYIPNELSQQQTKFLLMDNNIPYPLMGLDERKDVIVMTKQ